MPFFEGAVQVASFLSLLSGMKRCDRMFLLVVAEISAPYLALRNGRFLRASNLKFWCYLIGGGDGMCCNALMTYIIFEFNVSAPESNTLDVKQ